MLPTSFIGSVIVGKTIFERGRNNLEQQMLFGVASVSQILNDWMEDHRLILKSISNDPGIKTLDPDTATEALKRHEDAIPNSALTLYKLDGEAVASNATPKPKNTKARKDDRIAAQWFKRATNGENGLGLWRRSNGTSCLKQSRGIYRGKELIGIIAKCTIPEDIAARSGIKKTVMLHGEQSSVATALNLDQGINTGIGVALVSRQKQIVLLHLEGQAATNGGQLLNPIESQKSRWIPIAEKIIQAKSKQQATILNINHFLVASVPINDEFILAFILNTVPFLETFLLAGAGVGLANLTALTISTIALTRISKPLLKPIDVAGDALRQMSEGDFGIALPESTNRDIQKLYGYIEASSSQLSTYFKEVTRNAATNSQLEQAKKLQSGFLVKELPGSQAFTISAMCQPAYEIGADWYDAFRPDCETDESIVIVVADVCDKGIGSALYMSVFRSLLRLSLLKEWESCQCCGTAIKAAVETVNEYMACNHGQDAMFATAFVAAYSPSTQVMHYVVAGHEPPIIQTNQELSQLKSSGPAIGVFPSASYQIHQCILQPGSIVLAFSDGLVDTRNDTGESLGQQKVRSIMQEKDSQLWGAHELVERLNGAATTHRGKAEQFDDLTLMALKIERLNNTKSKQI